MNSLEELTNKINNLFYSEINDDLKNRFQNGLSHYTNAGAAIGIIENKVLWSSNIGFLNDPNDCISLVKQFCDFIYSKIMKTSLSDSVARLKRKIDEGLYDSGDYCPKEKCEEKDAFLCGLYSIVYGRYKGLFKIEGDDCNKFIVSFTMNDEDLDLPQWRSYADNGNGIRIDFNTKNLYGVASKFSENNKVAISGIFPCLYFKNDDYQNFSDRIVKFFLDFIEKNRNVDLMEICTSVSSCIEVNSLIVKDYYYKSENEARWVILLKRDAYDLIKFRNNRDGIISYVPLNFDESSIKEIICGPLMGERGFSSLKLFSKLKLNKGVPVSRSKITFVG